MESTDASTLAATVLGRFAAAIEHAPRPFVLGISGLQGSGKSTLAAALIEAAHQRGWGAVAMSLDDVYLTRAEREALAVEVHPLLRTRGVPGTHDLALLGSTLSALEKASPERPVPIPRFDKGHDDRYEEAQWPTIAEPPRLVVLEGWCLGVEPAGPDELAEPVNALERGEDADGRWRRWVDARLSGYRSLWERLDALVVLQAPSWDVVAAWRDEAERPLRERGEPRAMDDLELSRFLQHYERISRRALRSLEAKADVVLRLDEHRRACRR
ncbi:D-glycerate 3-kinase [Luteibacter jiangsuensis]|uniref:D-glycerate 3-kinase n=1 Tax=Luteibacter jiangsuensis TaxID=637577 RepID=A0ABT9T1V2_9GAMM|nr:kinase [Luteibacter jiangsuensis]MDQ0010152.1 D-glycerate 3-kinase [Luteibacter jiangsuensis]